MAKKAKTEIKFGTDGWRGVISDNFTFKNVAIVGQAVSEWVKRDTKTRKAGVKKNVSVAYDTRFLGREYAQIVSCILARNNIKVYFSDSPIPTPALSYGVVKTKGVAGIMITASHNPGKFNGIKIKTSLGGGAFTEVTGKIEKYLRKTPIKTVDFQQAIKERKVKIHDFKTNYLKFVKQYVDLKSVNKAKFKVIQDVMHGSGGRGT